MKLLVTVLLGVIWCGLSALVARADDPAPAVQTVVFHGQSFLVRTVDPKKEDLRLFWKDDQGNLLRDFAGLEKSERRQTKYGTFRGTNALAKRSLDSMTLPIVSYESPAAAIAL